MNNSKRRRLAAEAAHVSGNKPLPGGSGANRVTRRHGIAVPPRLVTQVTGLGALEAAFAAAVEQDLAAAIASQEEVPA